MSVARGAILLAYLFALNPANALLRNQNSINLSANVFWLGIMPNRQTNCFNSARKWTHVRHGLMPSVCPSCRVRVNFIDDFSTHGTAYEIARMGWGLQIIRQYIISVVLFYKGEADGQSFQIVRPHKYTAQHASLNPVPIEHRTGERSRVIGYLAQDNGPHTGGPLRSESLDRTGFSGISQSELFKTIPPFGWVQWRCMTADASECYSDPVAECEDFTEVITDFSLRRVVTTVGSHDGAMRGSDQGYDSSALMLRRCRDTESKNDKEAFNTVLQGMPASLSWGAHRLTLLEKEVFIVSPDCSNRSA
jgi:hypothetical protein